MEYASSAVNKRALFVLYYLWQIASSAPNHIVRGETSPNVVVGEKIERGVHYEIGTNIKVN